MKRIMKCLAVIALAGTVAAAPYTDNANTVGLWHMDSTYDRTDYPAGTYIADDATVHPVANVWHDGLFLDSSGLGFSLTNGASGYGNAVYLNGQQRIRFCPGGTYTLGEPNNRLRYDIMARTDQSATGSSSTVQMMFTHHTRAQIFFADNSGTDGKWRVYWKITDEAGSHTFATVLDDAFVQEWHEYSMTYIDGELRCFVDGDFVGINSGSGSTLIDPANHLLIGGNWVNTERLTGAVDEFRISTIPESEVLYEDNTQTYLLLHMDQISTRNGHCVTPDDDSANPGRDHQFLIGASPEFDDPANAFSKFVPDASGNGYALSFDGVNDRLTAYTGTANDELDVPADKVRIDVSAKAEMSHDGDSSNHYLFFQPNRYSILFRDVSSSQWNLYFQVWTGTGAMVTTIGIDDGKIGATLGETFDITEWHTYSMIFSNQTLYAFVDDVQIGSAATSYATLSAGIRDFNIGGAYNATYFWKGAIDEFRICSSEPLPVLSAFAEWLNQYDLGTQTNETDDADDDGLNNLQEYALGGNPTDASDQGTSPACGVMDVGGNSYFGYVCPQLSATNSEVTYTLQACTNLLEGSWSSEGIGILGTNVTGGSLNFVTNYTDTADDQKYLRLMIDRPQ